MNATVLRVPVRHARSPAPEPEFLRKRVDRYYRGRIEEDFDGGQIMVGRVPGPGAIQLVSNDYLRMGRHPEVIAAQRAVLAESDAPVMAAVFLHGDSSQARFEATMADWMQAEATLLAQSGWAANTGLIQAIAAPETPCYIDMFAHASLWEGIQSAGATAFAFRHNSVEHLERQIRRQGPGLIIVDSVYSTSGSIAPLRDLVEVAERHGCVLIVDEAHSLGTHGPQGRGLVVELGLAHRVHVRTASLAKAFAGRAGTIACSRRMAEYIKYYSNPAIFSSGLLPHEIAGLEATQRLIVGADDRRQRLHANADRLRAGLTELGYNLDLSRAQILGLEAGPERRTIVLRDALESRGVFGSVFCAPATPKQRSLIRFTVHSELTEEELDRIIAVCAEIRDEVALDEWPSTRRRSRVPLNPPLAAVSNG
ncbi:MAG: alpha-hydroxyketone-type quorum-sensing autoinducer synthase [Pseudomonadales bacterium]|jgi:CAI-1 autoinducer synthase|nr:alpha-hydroxyketone-type quorum-sensing autoinducer synthase [Pseudomonadales bacterium]